MSTKVVESLADAVGLVGKASVIVTDTPEKRRPGRPKGSLTKLKAKIAAIAAEENDD